MTAERAGKPNSVPQDCSRGDGHFSGPPVARRLKHPTRGVVRSGPPRGTTAPGIPDITPSFTRRLRGLAGGGVYPATVVANRAVRSYRTISPLPEMFPSIGGVFSVALSRALLPVAVSHHRALSSSDFPPGSESPRATAWPTLLSIGL